MISSLVSSSLQLSESIEVDDTQYKRSYINISASNLETFGGKLEFILHSLVRSVNVEKNAIILI